MKNNSYGFTLVELVLVLGIILTLFGMTMFNLVGTQQTSEVGTTADTLVSDMASQQTKAMLGIGTSSGTNYGIYFQTDRYVLFKGNYYNPADSTNFTVMLNSGLQFSNITFPQDSIIFSSVTGTASGFLSGANSVSVGESDGTKTKTISVNRYGIVISEN